MICFYWFHYTMCGTKITYVEVKGSGGMTGWEAKEQINAHTQCSWERIGGWGQGGKSGTKERVLGT